MSFVKKLVKRGKEKVSQTVSGMYVRSLTFKNALATDESGQALSEYGMLIGLIALVVIIVIIAFGQKLNSLFQSFLGQI